MNSENLINLFKYFAPKKDNEFINIAYKIIEEEKRKNHILLAKKLEEILEQNKMSNNSIIKQFPPVPRDNGKGFRLISINEYYLTFDDLIVEENIKNQLLLIIEEWKKAEILYTYGLKPVQKILFFGPPGTGKTLTAKVISSVLERPLITVNFESVISSYLGETSSNLRKIFDYIEQGKWVVLFDEFDVIGKKRDDETEHGEIKRVVNNFMLMLENYVGESLIIAATNHPHILDNAIWRRFDEKIYFKLPTKSEREKLFRKNLKVVKSKNIDYDKLSTITKDFSGSDIEQICIKTIKKNILNDKNSISTTDLEETINLFNSIRKYQKG